MTQKLKIPPVFFSLLLGLCIGIGSYTFYDARGFSYLTDKPEVCANCHIMRTEYDGWQKSSHHAVAVCNDCHLPHELLAKYLEKTEDGITDSIAFTLMNFHEPISPKPRTCRILEQNCRRCHGEMTAAMTGSSSGESVKCVRCHKDVGH